MRASTIMLAAALLYLVHRWAANQKALDTKTVVEVAFAVFVIAMLDQGNTEPVARGFAWLFFAGAAYAALPTIGNAAKGGPVTKSSGGKKLWRSSIRAT